LRKGQPYQPWSHPNGYLGVGRRGLAHRIVALCWIGEPEDPSFHIHHRNHDKTDNRSRNLEWTSQGDHIRNYHPDTSVGLIRSPETRLKISQARMGQKDSEETKRKKREASLRLGLRPPARTVGQKMPASFTERMRECEHPAKQACEVNGVKYRSFSDAGRALGERPLSLRKRCLSKNFPSYRVL